MFNFKLFREAQQESEHIRSDMLTPIYTEFQQQHKSAPLELLPSEQPGPPISVSKRQFPQPSGKDLDKSEFTMIYNPLYQTYIEQLRGRSDEELRAILENIVVRYPARKAGVYEWNIPNEVRAQYQAAYELLYKIGAKTPRLSPEENIAQIQSRIFFAIHPQIQIVVDLLQNNPNAESILYTAAQNQPRHLRGTDIGLKVFFIINDVRNFIFDNMNIDKTRKGPKAFEIFEIFLDFIAKKLGIEFLSPFVKMFGNPKLMEVAKELREFSKKGLSPEDMSRVKQQALEKIRHQYVLAGAYDTNQLYSRLVQQYPQIMTPSIFTQLARPNQSATGINIRTTKRLKSLFDSCSATGEHGDIAIQKLINLINKDIIGQYYTKTSMSGVARLWSIPVTDEEGRVINDYMTNLRPITKGEILDAAGFNYATYPTDFPEDEIEPQEEDWFVVDGEPQKDNVDHAAHKARIAAILAECLATNGYIEPDENLSNIVHMSVTRNKMQPGSIDEKIFYIWNNYCKRDVIKFAELLSLAGYEYIAKNVEHAIGGQKQSDPVFVGFGIADRTGSKNERELLETLRNDYGLMANAFRMSLNSPTDCLINPRGFVVDFMFPGDVLTGWEQGEDGVLHPKIATQIIFVGEALGWDQDTELEPDKFNFEMGEVIKSPSGDMQLIKINTKDGIKVIFKIQKTDSMGKPVVDAETQKAVYEETIATVGSAYKVRTEWKKMYEAFAATLLGGSTIFLRKRFTPREVQEQLDARSILWSYKNGQIVGAALLEVAEYVEKYPNSEAAKYVKNTIVPQQGQYINTYTQRKFTPKQSYALSALAQYRLHEGLLPIYARAESDGYQTKDIFEYIQELNNIYTNINKTSAAIRLAYMIYRNAQQKGDTAAASEARNRMNHNRELLFANRERLSQIKERYVGNISQAFSELEKGEFKSSELLSRQHRYLSGLNRIQQLVAEAFQEGDDLTENMSGEDRAIAIQRRSELEQAILRVFTPLNLSRGVQIPLFEQSVMHKKTTASWYKGRSKY